MDNWEGEFTLDKDVAFTLLKAQLCLTVSNIMPVLDDCHNMSILISRKYKLVSDNRDLR